MKKLVTLFTDSYCELKQVKTTTVCAMLAAISVILGYFTLAIGEFIKIGFSGIPGMFAYYLFGPVVGAVFGGGLDILNYIIKPTGPFSPGFTISAIIAGIIYGCMLYKKPLKFQRILVAELVVTVIQGILINTLLLSILYGQAFWVILPMRTFKGLIMWPINALIFYSVAKVIEASGIYRLIRK